jgi:hypothetical protein
MFGDKNLEAALNESKALGLLPSGEKRVYTTTVRNETQRETSQLRIGLLSAIKTYENNSEKEPLITSEPRPIGTLAWYNRTIAENKQSKQNLLALTNQKLRRC